MRSQPRYVLIVTIEGLGTNLVGCYGGAIGPTKHLDSFACRSIVFDQFWADTLQPIDVLESMWTGKHFVERGADSSDVGHALFDRAMLITDAIEIIEVSTRENFGCVSLVDEHPELSEGHDQPQIARLFEAALGQWATQLDEFPILWIHSRGLNGTWDAPHEYRRVMCDEGDPEPPFETAPAELKLSEETDPDEVFGLACALGGQSMVIDEAWSMIEEFLGEIGIADNCLQVLAGIQGYPIGEHGWVGHGGQALYAESLHLPLLVRPGNQLEVGVRVPFMVQPNSILNTIEGWLDVPEEKATSALCTNLVSEIEAMPAEHWPTKNQLAYSCFENQSHVAVPAWSCRWTSLETPAGMDMPRVELFATPEDRWQQNEISQRALAIVEEITEHRNEWLRCCQKRDLAEWTRLSSELTHPVR